MVNKEYQQQSAGDINRLFKTNYVSWKRLFCMRLRRHFNELRETDIVISSSALKFRRYAGSFALIGTFTFFSQGKNTLANLTLKGYKKSLEQKYYPSCHQRGT